MSPLKLPDNGIYQMKRYLYQKEYPIMGVMMKFMTSSIDAIRLVEKRFEHWLDLPEYLIRPGPSMLINITELPSNNSDAITEQVEFRIEDEILTGTGIGFNLQVDRNLGKAEVWIESEVLRLTNFFTHDILGAIVRFLIFSRDRVPLHASTMIKDDVALILYGKSGSGKSTLSYQLLKRGAEILSESAVFISSEDQYRLWGDVQEIYLRPDVRALFPELTKFSDKELPNGKIKMPVQLSILGIRNQRRLFFSGKMILIILEKSDSDQSNLVNVSPQEVLDKLNSERESGFDLSDKFFETIKNLPVSSTYVLNAGNDLSYKAELLENLCNQKNF